MKQFFYGSRSALGWGCVLWACSAQQPAAPQGVAGAAGTAGAPGAEVEGSRVYEQPLSDGNSFACATCHALSEPSPDGIRRPGHPLGDATRRTRWKGGKAKTFLQAVNSCVTEWMVAPAWTEDEPRFTALRDFLDDRAPAGDAPDVSFEIVQPPNDVSGGQAERGRALFDRTCAVCHGAGGLGTLRGPRVAGSVREASYIAQRIRTSGSSQSDVYDGLTGGVMPFWAKDRLNDDELRDLVAFVTAPIESSGGGAGAAGAGMDAGAGGTGASGSSGLGGADNAAGVCAKTSPRIGWTADLGVNTGEGQVSGFVTMIDDCTLELTHFSYDGNGIEVHVYGSKAASFRPGFVIGPDLFGHQFNDEALRVQLPADKTLGDLDWVSIWCVAAGANFGSGPFKAP